VVNPNTVCGHEHEITGVRKPCEEVRTDLFNYKVRKISKIMQTKIFATTFTIVVAVLSGENLKETLFPPDPLSVPIPLPEIVPAPKPKPIPALKPTPAHKPIPAPEPISVYKKIPVGSLALADSQNLSLIPSLSSALISFMLQFLIRYIWRRCSSRKDRTEEEMKELRMMLQDAAMLMELWKTMVALEKDEEDHPFAQGGAIDEKDDEAEG
jgi:hypothetical protein